jgi:hypothetical protein
MVAEKNFSKTQCAASGRESGGGAGPSQRSRENQLRGTLPNASYTRFDNGFVDFRLVTSPQGTDIFAEEKCRNCFEFG